MDIFLSNPHQEWSNGRLLYVGLCHGIVQYTSRIILDIFRSYPRQNTPLYHRPGKSSSHKFPCKKIMRGDVPTHSPHKIFIFLFPHRKNHIFSPHLFCMKMCLTSQSTSKICPPHVKFYLQPSPHKLLSLLLIPHAKLCPPRVCETGVSKWSSVCLLYAELCQEIVYHTSGIMLNIFLSNPRQKWPENRLLHVHMDRDLVQYTSRIMLDIFCPISSKNSPMAASCTSRWIIIYSSIPQGSCWIYSCPIPPPSDLV